jgi:sulfur-carrier protein
MIRIVLPSHLKMHASVNGEVELEIDGAVTQRSVLDALERSYPVLRGAIRDHSTQQRRPYLRFFACQRDLSHESRDAPLPDAVATGSQPFIIVGALAGG